ncbi:hypothetical protein DNTS_023947 [Danionella cerebrum]|uniref:Chromogranin-A n=1 Tax=Danionella cerebrum TaxID=2873325 RepID=A0A553MV37_9TELE|nr:hypothetical protein DNTS_023947 [Danionella translucida]
MELIAVPVSPGHMDERDVMVMKCIVEVIADALTQPHPLPVSKDCLETLRTDDRLVSILRHRNFLQELQDIAAEDDDQSMLVTMEKPEEDAVKREARADTEMEDPKHNQIPEKDDRDEDEHSISRSMNTEQERESQEEATIWHEEKHSMSGNDPAHNEEGGTAMEHLSRNPDIKQSIMEDSEQQGEADSDGTHSKEIMDEGEEKKGEVEAKPQSSVSKPSQRRAEMAQQGPEGVLWKSPEEQELQLIAQTQGQDKPDEEGSGGRKTGDTELESLAAIESELESVAQKLHDLRRG